MTPSAAFFQECLGGDPPILADRDTSW
ncbi:hypothetical protein FRAAL0328 [Frankia alni ACN14a]|uniref:Uncharacterized protein n=1 Tax=Frankia alni (strain DSM 45986 / CECT 9034 / ACN14a) TaxID=326424 RepID=Q0RTU4_FRAAA|nr:hypothetical protein FRAAL0328 [Frankia alni ACN14a]